MESYEKINYALRPNKRTQRKMIFDLLAHYVAVFPKRRFRYVGFGSMWFADFLYAHRQLGLKALFSIERREGYRRAVYNRPFRCVRVIPGDSSVVLPSLNWTGPSIVWLDYDYAPESESLQDIAFLSEKLASGSILIVTYDARPPWKSDDTAKAREAVLRQIFKDAVPLASTKSKGGLRQSRSGLTFQSEYGSTLAATLWSYLKNLLIQNGRSEKDQVTWSPLFSFSYRDGAPMITLGAGLLNRADHALVNDSEILTRSAHLLGETIFHISIPPLRSR